MDFMDAKKISNNALNEITPKDYVKPKMEFGNYFLYWRKHSYGIPKNEVDKFKVFFKAIAPALVHMVDHAEQLQKQLEEETRLDCDDLNIKAYTPMIYLIHDAKYYLSVSWDGHFFIDRKEMIYGSPLDLIYELGEILQSDL